MIVATEVGTAMAVARGDGGDSVSADSGDSVVVTVKIVMTATTTTHIFLKIRISLWTAQQTIDNFEMTSSTRHVQWS